MSRRPDVLCSGGCGRLLWTGSTSLAAGDRKCNDCRRSSPVEHGTRRGYREQACRCSECVEWSRAEGRAYAARRRADGRPIKRFGSSGPWINPTVKLAVFERDAWTCQLCGVALDREADPNGDLFPSIDHVVPQSKGGGHEPENLRAAHRWCNAVRQDREVA